MPSWIWIKADIQKLIVSKYWIIFAEVANQMVVDENKNSTAPFSGLDCCFYTKDRAETPIITGKGNLRFNAHSTPQNIVTKWWFSFFNF